MDNTRHVGLCFLTVIQQCFVFVFGFLRFGFAFAFGFGFSLFAS
jgi:hypothetical protein